MASPARAVSARAAIPYIYRFIITTLEPLFAVNGAMLSFFWPATYLHTMTRHSQTFSAPTTFLYTELGGAWLYFAFVEAVVLRMFDDLGLWRVLCMGMILSDLAYCHSCAQAVGGWGAWVVLSDWTVEDWFVFWGTAPFLLVRVLIVLGVGIRQNGGAVKRE
ncbi:hypothetical protein QBC46DRAFT_387646 [Diplogelasinospora grovesii]|uniref:DUF7704 domain-containing protein n=1 Tax=Diplogelasinospora grovesii TaxID=303347 RepID=A0AAN6N8Z8_9PEZI|nr:hypothetical protein QBC46DRAFT_387646 [Diplogelasinospora grovesii]